MAGNFLCLPVEIRLHIYTFLLSDNSVTIQSLFTRRNFQTSFMSKHNCGLHPSILYVCKQVNHEASPVLYRAPRFQCATATLGLERLRAQIGRANFSFIHHLVCDPTDLGDIALALEEPAGLFRRLETLCTDGYRIKPLDGIPPASYAERQDLAEALRLCKQAASILDSHDVLSVLAESFSGISNGGADAVDTTNPRAKWRFLKCEADLGPEEHMVDLGKVVELLRRNGKGCERSMNAGKRMFVDANGAWSYRE